MTKAEFFEALHDSDEIKRAWAIIHHDQYISLRDSRDPLKRKYWWSNVRETFMSTRTPCYEAQQKLEVESYQELLDPGVLCSVSHEKGNYYVLWKHFELSLLSAFPKWSLHAEPDIEIDKKAWLHAFLFYGPSPLSYAQKALPDDPCNRLVFAVNIGDADNRRVVILAGKSQGRKPRFPMKLKRVVDVMEGIWCYKSMILPRRLCKLSEKTKDQWQSGWVESQPFPGGI
ncbi:hypothetical protein N7478_013053 [Penicillium angulare]|uniref:uncharacterized protein n=1 Tax=Penicillium angulare TaxID=116970 RepID=UPI00253F7843|nr:uncharacterized protein N7478_013053 [Penicillium angulare]KAJ5256949.1 hypothetical protein N7478_013053 [Penicillium angulare]